MADLDRCPSCGQRISRVDPTSPTRRVTVETAACPQCGAWLERRPGEAWRVSR